MSKDQLDNQTEGQISIADLYDPPERLCAVSRIFARARKNMSLAEQKTFVYTLSQLDFKETAETAKTNVIYLDKKTLAEIVGVHSDTDHLSVHLNDSIKNLPLHSYIQISDKDKDLYASGCVVSSIVMLKNRVRIRFTEDFIPLFKGLTTNYITLWSTDIFNMTSKRSVQFYEYLRQITDTRKDVNDVGLGVKAIKEMFDIPKDGKGSYMRKDGHFDRPAFERYVIDPICEDLSKCKMISLVIQPDGKYYEKIKRGNRVDGYRFYWTYTSHPAVASAAEVKELQERVDKNPQVLKVAKDIVKGDKKQKKASKSPESRDYDYGELEQVLLQSRPKED